MNQSTNNKRKKNIILLICACLIVIISVLCVLMLKDDKKDDRYTQQTTQETPKQESKTSEKDIITRFTENALYNKKVKEYSDAVTMGSKSFIEKYGLDCSSINALMVQFFYDYDTSIRYVSYDVNNDGTEELLFSDGETVIDIYTVKGNRMIKLFPDCSFGGRKKLHLLADGTLLSEGASSAFDSSAELFELQPGGKLVRKSAFYYDDRNDDSDYYDSFERLEKDEYRERVSGLMSQAAIDCTSWTNLGESIIIQHAPDNIDTKADNYVSFEFADPGGTPTLVFSAVRNVKNFEFFRVTNDSETFEVKREEEALYSKPELKENEEIVINMGYWGDIFPCYGISYTDENGVYNQFYIMDSGRDGSLFLGEF